MVRILGFSGKKVKFAHNCPTLEFTIPNEKICTNSKTEEAAPPEECVEEPEADYSSADLWEPSDLARVGKYNPDRQIVYHLFTGKNPTISQPLRLGEHDILKTSNFNAANRTVLLLHGWIANVTAECNIVLTSAFLASGDVNVLAVDWSAGADTANYLAALSNTRLSGKSSARFISWLNKSTGASFNKFHLVGYSLGAHLAGLIGRNLEGKIGYITGLDPALLGFVFNSDRLRATDALYTEVIHTNAGLLGYPSTLGHADFYPNGGINMPGCANSMVDHARCAGIFYLETNLLPPFSKG